VVGYGWRWVLGDAIEDGGDVVGRAEISPECGFIEVDERVFAGLCGQGDEVGSQDGPGRFVGDLGYDLLGSAVERVHNCGSDDLLRGGVQAIGVALHRIMQPGRRVAESAEERRG
jgi:hypothetical protein